MGAIWKGTGSTKYSKRIANVMFIILYTASTTYTHIKIQTVYLKNKLCQQYSSDNTRAKYIQHTIFPDSKTMSRMCLYTN